MGFGKRWEKTKFLNDNYNSFLISLSFEFYHSKSLYYEKSNARFWNPS